jgi:hypothetical protein
MCTVINKVGGQASGSRHVGNVRKVIEDQEPDVAMSLIDDEDRLRSDSEPVGVARRPTDSDAGDRLDGVARLCSLPTLSALDPACALSRGKRFVIAPRLPRTCAVTHSHWPNPSFPPFICMRLRSNRMFTTKTRRLTSALAK